MKRTQVLGSIVLTAMLLMGGQALAQDLAGTPGYIDLEWIDIPADAEEIQDIDLGLVLLGIAADAGENEDQALLQMLSMIKSIRVKSWTPGDSSDAAVKAMGKVAKILKKDKWKRLIHVKNKDESTTVSTRYVGKDMVGLMIVTYQRDGAVAFINVMGDLDLSTLFKLVQQFDHGSIEQLLDDLGEIEGAEVHHN